MMTPALNLSPKQTQLIIWTLLFLMPIIGMAVDLVSPSLPDIARSLHTSNKLAKDIISIYLLGYALGNFMTGFLTDALGRQKLIRISLFSFVIISLIPVFIPNIKVLLLARFFQGITIGSVSVLARSIFSDVLPPEKLVRLGTLIGTMWGLGPVLGPVIGGYLQFYFGWQAGFVFFAAISFIGFIATLLIVPETHFTRQSLHFKTMKTNLIATLSHREFMGFVFLMGIAYALIITFQTLGPFLVQNVLQHTPVFFGHLALCLGLVFLISTFVCRQLIKYYAVDKLYFMCINILMVIGLVGVLFSFHFYHNILFLMIINSLLFFECGFIFPMSMGKGLAFFRHIAGTATATMYLINTSITSLVAYLAGFIEIHSVIPMMLVDFLLVLLATIIYWTMIHRKLSNHV